MTSKTMRPSLRSVLVLPLLLMSAAGHASMVMAQATDTFTATGNLMTARSQHTATLLHDGKVLIAGGESSTTLVANPESPLASAELYDPSTGTFTATGNMIIPRRLHAATLLPDGKVLLTGGYGSRNAPGSGRLSNAELYDPSTGTFAATGNMLTPQGWHTGTLLSNGKVLITGGFTMWPMLAKAEIYDAVTGTFAATGSYAGTRGVCDFCPPSTLLADGKVLFAGTVPAQIYDAVTGAFSLTGVMRDPDRSTATLLMNGTVLFTGGESIGRLASAELYDPVRGTFISAPDMAWRRVWHTTTLMPDGTALIVGGESDECSGNSCVFSGSTDSAELFDPARNTFVSAGNMTVRRSVHTATLLNDGRVLIAGGVSYGGIGKFFGSLSTVELYQPPSLMPAPALLSLSGDGQGQGAILHAGTPQTASSSNPAVPGEALEIYCTGLVEGSAIPPQVALGGRLAEILYVGKAPGFANLNQVNVRVPSGITPGPAVSVRLTYLGRPSNEVTIGVQ
jgi:hypothetical protein